MEYVILNDYKHGYTEDGDCVGEFSILLHPERLGWSIDDDAQVMLKKLNG
jgi:hypothetical protein